MAYLDFTGVGITAISAAVPKRIINNYEYTEFFSAEEVKDVVDKIGVFERRFTDENTCSSDLCYAAAEKLFSDNDIDRSEIDLHLLPLVSERGVNGSAFLTLKKWEIDTSTYHNLLVW